MPVITFWGNNERNIGQTVSASLVATVMAIEYNYKVLLISADFNDESMEKCFGEQESNAQLIKSLMNGPKINLESGINGLLKLADSNRVSPEIIHDYTKIVFKNRLEVLYSPLNIIEEKDKEKYMQQIKNIISHSSRYYDYVIVDLKKGNKYNEQIEILKNSDVIVLNVQQKIQSLENLLGFSELNPMLYKCIWNICKYDDKSKYNIKNMTRKLLRQQPIYEMAYNTLLFDASQEGDIAEFVVRIKTVKDENENSLLIKKTSELVQGILMKYQEARSRM